MFTTKHTIGILGSILLLLSSPALGQGAQRDWWSRARQERAGYYTIKTDLPAQEARDLARHLNIMYEAYARRLASLPQRAPEKLNVLIFASRQDYLDVLRVRFGVNGQGSGGMFFVNPLGTALAFWTEGLPRQRILHVAQHEGFHQFAWSRFGNDLPIWVNEGLAEFFGEAILVGKDLLIGQSTPRTIDSVKEAIDGGGHIPFQLMLDINSNDWNRALRDGTAGGQYHQAWSMVHFLVYAEGGRYAQPFSEYLRLLNRGVRSREAFVRVFGSEIGPFEEKWKRYARKARPSALATAIERAEFLAEGALELSRLGVVPVSLEELKTNLIERSFSHTLASHGWNARLEASAPVLYKIPHDELAEQPPLFVVEAPNINRVSRRERKWNETIRRPPSISTQRLKPRNIEVVWERDRATGAVSYEIVVKR